MLFLAWLAVSFVIVVAVNLYLRYFGLPRRPLTGASTTTTADGRVISSTGVVSYGPGGVSNSTGFASGFQGFLGGLTGGTVGAGSSTSGVHGGETGRWVNAVLAWIYNRTPSGSARPEVLDAWIKALSDEADQQSRDIRIRFDDVRGSIPEFTNFSVGPSNVAVSGGQTAAMAGGLTVFTTVTAKDVSLQMCMLTQTAVSSRTVYSDVYLLHLHGQLKVVISPNMNSSEMSVHISFATAPEIRLQILPSGRLDNSVDIAAVEKAVRGALGNTTTKLSWSSAGGFRSAYAPTQMQQQIQQQQLQQAGLRTENHMDVYKQPINQPNAFGSVSPQQGFSVNQTATGYNSPSVSGLQQFQQPTGSLQQQQQLHTMQTQQQQQQQQQQYMQPHQQQQMQYSTSGDMMRPFDQLNNQNTQFTTGNVTAHRLLIKVIKANGLGNNDSGSCNAYCVIRVDRPPQNYMTSVARNTVNPLWDESFVVDIDMNTRQLQLDVLDRDKPPDTELLGKTIIQMDEIRRMPASSRQILPLTGRPRSRTTTSGSVTVEFAIMDAADLSRLPVVENVNAMHTSQLHQSPQSMTGAAMHTINNNTMQSGSLQFSADATGGQYGGGYQNRLSAHDMALSQQTGLRPQDSPSLVVTGSELHRTNPQYQATGTLDARGRGQEKKESFASALKKRLSRGPAKKRSQSADRTQLHSQSLHDPYLRPPGDNMGAVRGTDTTGMLDASGDRKVRSNSFSSSLRRIFKPSSSSASDGAKSNISREGSLTRTGNMPATSSGLGDTHFQQQQQQYQLQQQMGYGTASGFDRSMRQNTPVPPEHRGMVDVHFGGSMSTTPPAQHHSMGLSASVGGRY